MPGKMLTLNIGEILFSIHLPAESWLPPVAAQYGAFVVEGGARPLQQAPDIPWQVELRHDPTVESEPQGWVRRQGARSDFHVLEYVGWLDLTARQASISAPSPARALSALDRILATICMQALPRERNSLLLHAAGIVIEEGGYIFAGASGSGKTTIARLASEHGYTVLTDENVIIQIRDDGGVHLQSTPFWGHSTPTHLIHPLNLSVPLRALYLLNHAPEFQMQRLTPGRAIAALLTTEKVAVVRPESAAIWLDVAERLVRAAPIHQLGFRPTPGLWDFLHQKMPRAKPQNRPGEKRQRKD